MRSCGPSRKEAGMNHSALRIIHEEHAALAAMLRSIVLLLARHREQGTLPDFAALRAMLFYVDEFPERLHHAKESQLLFPMIRARTAEAADLLDRLDRDHAGGERAIRDLEHTLLGFEMLGESRRAAFEHAAENYVNFYFAHMTIEEKQILPLAERVLSASDWAELDRAFEGNRDPLTGAPPDEEYRQLFSRIVNAVPAPIGLGPAG
jgi:hemerythrin-like domain-containing protein